MPFAWHGRLLDQLVEPSVRSIGSLLPVVLLTGPPGSGRSTFLGEVERRYRHTAPLARAPIVLDQPRHLGALAPLLVDYDRAVGGRRLTFPRTLLGIAAAAADIDHRDPSVRRQKLLDALADAAGVQARVSAVLGAAFAAASAAPAPAPSIASVVEALDLAPVVARRWQRGRRAARWFGSALGQSDHVDALVLLNDVAAERREDSNGTVGDVLVAAFLADLAAGFHGSPSGRGRRYNCLLLLDDADGPAARAFLLALTRARAAAALGRDRPPDPLVVLAAFAEAGPVVPMGAARTQPGADTAVPATLEAWWSARGAHAGDAPARWWFEVPLPPVRGAADVTELIGAPAVADQVRLVESVANGHPRISRALLDGVADALRGPNSSTAVDDLLDRSLPDEAHLRQCLTTIAAAHNVSDQSCRHALAVDEVPRDLSSFLARTLWVLRDRGPEPVLHPAIRRLLLHRLATRSASDPYHWTTVHDRLARRREITGDRASLATDMPVRAYHLLACVGAPGATVPVHRLRTVVDVLDAALARTTQGLAPIESWWSELRFVTSAPRAVPGGDPQGTLAAVQRADAEAGGTWTPLTRLVVTRWLGADRLADPGRTLLQAGAHSCRELANDPRLPEGGHERAFLIGRAVALEGEIE